MASVEVNFPLIEQGATYAFSLCWGVLAVDADGEPILDAEGLQTSVPYDLTGCEARMQFRLKQTLDPILTATSVDGDITLISPIELAVTSLGVASNVLTVSAVAHGLEVGSVFQLSGSTYDGFYAVASVVDADHFTVALTSPDNTESGSFIARPAGGDNISVLLSDELTDGLIYTKAVHDLKVYWPGGEEDYVIHGSAVVRLRITADLA